MRMPSTTGVPDNGNNNSKALEDSEWLSRMLSQMRLLSRHEGKCEASSDTQTLYVLYTSIEIVMSIIPMEESKFIESDINTKIV